MLRRLLYMNGLAITGVVLFHAAGMGFVAMFAWAERYLPTGISPATQIGTAEYFLLRFFEQIAVFSIAAFLFVSGYFISIATGKQQKTIAWSIVFARIRTLIIPYLFWSIVVMFLQIILEGRSVSPTRMIFDLLTGGTNEVLYFVPLLIQFYLLAPLFVWAARRNWKLFLGIAALIQLIYILMPYVLYLNLDVPGAASVMRAIPKWLFITRIFWFSFGIVVGFHLEIFKKFFHRWRYVILATALVCIPLGMLEWEMFYRLSGQAWLDQRDTLIDTMYNLAVITAMITFADFQLPFSKGFERLGRESYGIYLTHFLFIEYTAKMIYRFFPQILGNTFLLLTILIAVGLGGPVLLMYLADHSPGRRFYAHVFG